jgi:hypothetical protein
MQSRILLAATLIASAAFAQRTVPTDSKLAPKEGTTVVGGTVTVTGSTPMLGTGYVNGGMIEPSQVAIVMDRDFREAIQGNLDRETIERSNGETR